jgi:tRNA pseudouridine38-40 synthase
MGIQKTRYFIYISFKGTSYHGWQVQPRSSTVQKILNDALSIILNERVCTTGAGRTDTGVHAKMFCAHFDCSFYNLDTDCKILYRLNGLLPKDISASSLLKVIPDAHARFSASSRTYEYYISRLKNPFSDDLSWYFHGDLNVESMNEAGRILLKHSDFTSFSRLHTDVKNNICRIYAAHWEESKEILVFTIKADRFLRNMVRAIVGTMIEVGTGKIDTGKFEEIILARDRGRAGQSAPAKGLFLTDIEYPDEIFIKS